jgi:hypothetical protein
MRVVSGKQMKPLAVLAHGERGTGKTNLPIEAYKAIWIGNEETDEYDVARLPKIEFWEVPNKNSPNAEAGFINQLQWLLNGEHDYKSLVVDTMDGLETIAENYILSGAPGKTMATAFGGYGKAYEKMELMFKIVRDQYLVPLRDKRGMNIIILCHTEKYKVEDPMTSTSYDRYQTAMHKSVKPVFEDWVSAIFFVSYQLYKAENQAGKEHAVGSGARVIYTEERPSHVAKNRFSLPYEIPYNKHGTWAVIGNHVKNHFNGAPKFVAPAREAVAPITVEQTADTSGTAAPSITQDLTSTPAVNQEAIPVTAEEKTAPITHPAQNAPAAAAQAPAASDPDQPTYIEICKKIDNIWQKVPESNRPSIQISLQRAGQDVKELVRIYNKIETLTK